MTKCAACSKGSDGQKKCAECELDQALKDYWKDRLEPSDEVLFETPPPAEECPICMHSIDTLGFVKEGIPWYMPCCGKTICAACNLEIELEGESGLTPCAFYRTPTPRSNKARLEMAKKRMKKYDDANAIYFLAECYQRGVFEVQNDYKEATRLYFRAHRKGCRAARWYLGSAYFLGNGVDCDFVLGMKWHTLAAIEGNDIMQGYKDGHVKKDDLEKALRAHQRATDDLKSDRRDAIYEKVEDRCKMKRDTLNCGM
ncbi:hypothetical protein ACHAWF_013657 [Thalassiosira exigua]